MLSTRLSILVAATFASAAVGATSLLKAPSARQPATAAAMHDYGVGQCPHIVGWLAPTTAASVPPVPMDYGIGEHASAADWAAGVSPAAAQTVATLPPTSR